MSASLAIEQVRELPPDLPPLAEEAASEGHRFMIRLIEAWASGANRFDDIGECLLTVRSAGALIAIGGLNRDPFPDARGAGRIRHVYVRKDSRRQGVGAVLLDGLVEAARPTFDRLRLRTDTREAAAFYCRHGFELSDCAFATHVRRL